MESSTPNFREEERTEKTKNTGAAAGRAMIRYCSALGAQLGGTFGLLWAGCGYQHLVEHRSAVNCSLEWSGVGTADLLHAMAGHLRNSRRQ